jgi:hypothetical protein
MDKTESDKPTYSFSAVSAEQFVTGIDLILDSLRAKARSIPTPGQPEQLTSGASLGASELLIPIAAVQVALNEAYELGRRVLPHGVEL